MRAIDRGKQLDRWIAEQEMLDVYTLQIRKLKGELLAAQERETENFEAMMDERRKAIDSAEREKALREALEAAEAWLTKDATGSGPFPISALNEIQRALVVGSPSEKPGSEDIEAKLADDEIERLRTR